MKRLGTDRGTTLVATLILLVALSGLTAAGLTAATSSMQISGNYRTGTQALLNAETGIIHSVQKINEQGVRRLDNEALNVWEAVFGSSVKHLSGYAGYDYTVTAASVPSNPMNRMKVTSTGQAPPSSLRRIEAIVKLDGAFSPGAIYMPGAAVNTDFNGNKFLVDGRDHVIKVTNPPYAEAEDRPGIALRSQSNVAPVLSTLSAGQYDNVDGVGGSPSVLPANGPSVSRIESDIAAAILAQPGVIRNPSIRGNDKFGLISPLLVPQITHFTGSVT
ncbi:MAG: pilus assembly PilX N-terminal domain-containing protein, partial [Candidatus Binatia bacterium]